MLEFIKLIGLSIFIFFSSWIILASIFDLIKMISEFKPTKRHGYIAEEEIKIGQIVYIENGKVRKIDVPARQKYFMGTCEEDIEEGDDCILENGILRKVKNENKKS